MATYTSSHTGAEIDAAVTKANQATTRSTQTVTIAVADWNSGTTCTKNVTGVTTDSDIICDSSDVTVEATSQGSGTITFTATATPTAAVTVKVLVLN